ncbi:hypothetical protein DENSPDRAFT_896392 [Dentipellis sp. KUC8613]|nr:hypothetical protein DENSPDRAFT_896392 [Dentipellis sp. KUC8613]
MDTNQLLQQLAQGQNDLQNALTALTQTMSHLAQTLPQAVQTAVQSMPPPQVNVGGSGGGSTKTSVQKPAPYKGARGDDARRFLAAFSVYAMATQEQMNIRQADGSFVRDDSKWIGSALSFLEEDAAVWATPALEKMAQNTAASSEKTYIDI